MADGSKSAPLTPEDFESTPLISKYSSIEVYKQSDLDVQQHESSTTESNKGNYGSVAATDRGGVNIDRAGSSCYGDDQKAFIRDAKVSKAEIALGEALRDAEDLANAAACDSLEAAIFCREAMSATCEAITEAKVRERKALRKAKGAAEYSESYRYYHALASRYNANIKLATTRVSQVEAAAESAENAATVAETAARKVAEDLNEDFNVAERLSAVDDAVNAAKTAAVLAYKTEYLAFKVMERCWEYLDHGNVKSGRFPTRQPEETRCGGHPNGKKIAWIAATISLILGICLLAGLAPHTKNPEHQKSLTALGSFLVGLSVCALIYKIVVCIIKKIKNGEREKNDTVLEYINNRLGELDKYFKSHNITPMHSDDEQ